MFIDNENIYIQSILPFETDLDEAGYYPPLYLAYAIANRNLLITFAKSHGLTDQLEGLECTNEWVQSIDASVNWISKHEQGTVAKMPERVYEDYLVLGTLDTLFRYEPLSSRRFSSKDGWWKMYDYIAPDVIDTLSKLMAQGCQDLDDENPNARYAKLFPQESEKTNDSKRETSGTIISNAFTRFFNNYATRKDICLILQHMNIHFLRQITLFLREYTHQNSSSLTNPVS